MSKSLVKQKAPQHGGTITSDIGNLAIPLGLILSRAGLEKLMARDAHKSKSKSKSRAKGVPPSTQRRSLWSVGGGAASPKKKAKTVTPPKKRVVRKSTPTGIEEIRVHFQKIAKQIQAIFLRQSRSPHKRKTHGRKAA